MKPFKLEIVIFDNKVVIKTIKPNPIPLVSLVVTASAGPNPNIKTNTGFLENIADKKSLVLLLCSLLSATKSSSE